MHDLHLNSSPRRNVSRKLLVKNPTRNSSSSARCKSAPPEEALEDVASMTKNRVAFSHTTKGKPPRLPFDRIKDHVLGKRYELSVVFVGDMRAQSLNKKYRKKNYIPNVLSFPLSENSGEIFINPHQAKREAPDFDLSARSMIGYLFIHGLLHLKGARHGATMEATEQKLLRQFDLL